MVYDNQSKGDGVGDVGKGRYHKPMNFHYLRNGWTETRWSNVGGWQTRRVSAGMVRTELRK